MLLLFDPLSATTQLEDRVILYADSHCKQRVCLPFYGQPLDAGDEVAEGEADKKKRAALLNKNWPRHALLVPGNSLTIVFDTASDYVNNINASKFGFRLVVTGHSLSLPSAFPLVALEREVAHAASLAVASSITAEAARTTSSLKTIAPMKKLASGPSGALHFIPGCTLHSQLLNCMTLQWFALGNGNRSLDRTAPSMEER
jgi:hypothetical protein